MDGVGFLPEERWHIWLLDARSGSARQLTDGVRDESDPAFSPDGTQIVYCSNHSTEPDLTPGAVDLFVRTLARPNMRKLAAPYGPKSAPVFSPDGRWIAYYGVRGEPEGWENSNLWVLPRAGGAARNLTGTLDIAVADGTINDLPGGPVIRPPTWSPDSTRIYIQVARHGDTLLHSIALGGAASLQTVVAGPGTVGAFSMDAAQRRVAYLAGSMASTDELCIQVLAAATTRQLTRHNSALLNGLRLGTIEELWFKGAADNPLQGWILKPPGFNPARKYPSILQIHGGPWAQYGNYFMHEFYFLAARGYVVYFCNPRGSQGYGEKHSKAILNKFGTADYADLMAFADLVQRKHYIDRRRMGVTGGSYGGFMASWIIGHTQRFRAAVVQRTVSNWTSMVGSSDGNTFFRRWLGHKAPWEDLQNYWRLSPIAHIGNARTPTLVIHSEQDMRCEIEQGEQLFVALKTLGVETEMVRFPEEAHGLSRGGRTDRRVERLQHIARWFDRYLKP
jgi:dipeptidyl aminopeptidase/acylaminoacyl peptidase